MTKNLLENDNLEGFAGSRNSFSIQALELKNWRIFKKRKLKSFFEKNFSDKSAKYSRKIAASAIL